MGARLKNEDTEQVILLSEMQPYEFAVIVAGIDKDHIVYRPHKSVGVFAIDLTDGYRWWPSASEIGERKVRILTKGETLIIE